MLGFIPHFTMCANDDSCTITKAHGLLTVPPGLTSAPCYSRSAAFGGLETHINKLHTLTLSQCREAAGQIRRSSLPEEWTAEDEAQHRQILAGDVSLAGMAASLIQIQGSEAANQIEEAIRNHLLAPELCSSLENGLTISIIPPIIHGFYSLAVWPPNAAGYEPLCPAHSPNSVYLEVLNWALGNGESQLRAEPLARAARELVARLSMAFIQ